MTTDDNVAAYRDAYDNWQKQLAGLHEVFLEKKRLNPVQLKGLLNREARAKRKYDLARLHLLGIEEEDAPLEDDDEEGGEDA